MPVNGTNRDFSLFSQKLNFAGKCTVTSYDRQTYSEKNPYTVEIKNNVITSIKNQMPLSCDYNKFSIFNTISQMDGNGDDITMRDLANLRKTFRDDNKNSYLKAMGITNVKYDGNLGLGIIEIANNEIIRIDFETKAELSKSKPVKTPPKDFLEETMSKNTKSDSPISKPKPDVSKTDSQAVEQIQTEEEQPITPVEPQKIKYTGKHYYDRSNTEIPSLYKAKLKKVAKKMNISEENLLKRINKASKETGYSEYFIKHLISMESFEPNVRNTGDGTITGGFGHTGLKDKTLKEGNPVNPNLAFKWLVSDIKFFENKIKNMKIDTDSGETMEKYFNALPLSMREAMIDVAFNRDANKIEQSDEYKSLRANIKAGESYLPACALRLRQNFDQYTFKQKLNNKYTTGLMERNCYRFLLAIRDFDSEYRELAKNRFENQNNYYTTTLKLKVLKKRPLDAFRLKQAWKSMK